MHRCVAGLCPPELRQRRIGLPLPSPEGVPLGLSVAHQQQIGHGRPPYWVALRRCASADPLLGPAVPWRSMATLRLFASAREAAGTGSTSIEGATVRAVIESATATFGPSFAALLPNCRIWRNGEPALDDDPVGPDDEIAVLPPVSGG